MSTLLVRNMQGEQVGEYELADDLLEFEKGLQSVHDAVVAHLANCRAGTASTLSKGEVHGAGRKPWKQKGTGRARAGYKQSPVWRGGGVAFGPKPRDFGKKQTRKEARLAFRRAVSEKVASGSVFVLDDLSLAEAKTREMAGLLKRLQMERGGLILMDEVNEAVARAARNIERLEVLPARLASTYQVLRYPVVVVVKSGLSALEARLGKVAEGGA